MTRAGVEARSTNLRLWDDGVLQKILDRIKQNGVGTSSKSMKKAMREERDRQKREKTVAKLERRMEEKEKKALRKKEKKRARQEEAEEENDEDLQVEKVLPIADPQAIEEAQVAAASLKGLAGGRADEDSEFSSSSRRMQDDLDDEEEEGSRYSLGVPAVAKKARRASPAPLYTAHTSDNDEIDSSDDEDNDVVLGGGGGDFVKFDSAQHSADESTDGSDSSDQVLQTLVPRKATNLKINGTAAKKSAPLPQEPPKKKSKKEMGSDSRKAAAAKRIAYWGAKGQKE